MVKFYFILFIVVYTEGAWSKSINNNVQQYDSDSKIVGGTDANIRDYPYQVYLEFQDGSFCGGSIVSEYHVVTAAHCLEGVTSIALRIGSTFRTSGGTVYNTSVFSTHPYYEPSTFEYDLSVIYIAEGMYLDGVNTRAIVLDGFFDDPSPGTNLIISGWGAIEEGGAISNTLQVAQVPVVNRTECAASDNKICAGYEEGGVDTCQGDSGGPAVSEYTGRLTGITSSGVGCARPDNPGLYTRVGSFYNRLYLYYSTGL